MKLLGKLKERSKQRKAHERYLAERERQQELSQRDTGEAVRDAATGAGAAGQAGQIGV